MDNNAKELLKVYNDKDFDGAVSVMNRPVASILVPAHSFVYLTRDEIAYNINMNTIFQSGLLRVECEDDILASNGIIVEDNPNFATKEDIQKILNGPQKKLESWLGTVHEARVMDEVFEIAKEMNLSLSKLKILQAAMPDKTFIEA